MGCGASASNRTCDPAHPLHVIVVGGVAGGASTAARLRRLTEDVKITIFEKGGYVSFANCGLPYYLGGEIDEFDKLKIVTPEKLYGRFNLNICVHREVVSIDRESKSVTVKNVETGETEVHNYDALVLSVGCEPIVPQSIPGIGRPGHFTLKSLEDTSAIQSFMAEQPCERVVVCGGGFIGLEITEQLVKRGCKVSLVEAMDQVMAPLDPEMAEYVHEVLEQHGVELHLRDPVAAFEEPAADAAAPAKASDVILKSGKRLAADLVILALGVRPATGIAKAAGIELTERGHIKVDDQMKTLTDPCVYALGDAIEVKNAVMGGDETWAVALGGPANRQGRICAEGLYEKVNASTYRGTWGTNGVKLWKLYAASVGVNDKFLRSKGIKFKTIYMHPKQHAEYWKNIQLVHTKVMFDVETGKIFGAQVVGEDGIDRRIDVIATAMIGGLTAPDLADVEMCYHPSWGWVRDPVNVVGMVASDIMDGILDTITPQELIELVLSGDYERRKTTLVEVRPQSDWDKMPIDIVPLDSVFVNPLDSLRERVLSDQAAAEKLRQGDIIVTCNSGQRAHVAARMLSLQGFGKPKVLTGSWQTYKYVQLVRKRNSLLV